MTEPTEMTDKTAREDHGARGSGEGRVISGSVIASLLTLVRSRRNDAGVAQALALAGEARPFSALADPQAWSTEDECVALFNAAALVTGDSAFGLHVGQALLFTPDGTGFIARVQGLGSPATALKHIRPVAEHFETASEAVALEVAGDHALIQVAPRSGHSRHAHLCEMTRGMLTELPRLFGRGAALITEFECSARGGLRCLYAMSWDDNDRNVPGEGSRESAETTPTSALPTSAPTVALGHPAPPAAATARPPVAPPVAPAAAALSELAELLDGGPPPLGHEEPSIAELRAELSRMSVLVEGTVATALELLGEDVESLLSEIAARADAVVTAHRFLLMIRAQDGIPIQLHHRGLEPHEAQQLAGTLWRGLPDEDPSRLVIDIASPRRRYGRLVELIEPGAAVPRSEAKVLNLFAEYAATALDIYGMLLDAKRSNATAHTLLSFSRALSVVTTQSELVTVLADTVPSFTECDGCSTYLWDRDEGQLRMLTPAGLSTERSLGLGPFAAVVPDVDAGASNGTAPHGPHNSVGSNGSSSGSATDTAVMATVAMDRLVNHRQVVVADGTTDDPQLRALLAETGAAMALVAPLFASGEFLGVITANISADASPTAVHDPDLHERLIGVADQAATALQNLDLLERVSHMAWHDSLTGLPNRRLFEDRVEQELVRSRRVGEPVCLFFVDLDHFKNVNDTFGHTTGDDLICQVGHRLVDTVRQQDTVARVGGDEFAVLLPGLADQLAIDQLAQRCLEALGAPFSVFGQEIVTTASIGIAVAPDHGDSHDELLSHADEAMYRAKGRGRNDFQMYTGSLDAIDSGQPPMDERTLYSDLVRGLANGEFFVLYQPYIDLRSTQVTGVEALVRWNHPTLGVLEPSSFISLAERSNIIVSLDTWVLEQTCRQARVWLDHGLPPLQLSVNLASRDLSNPELFDNIHRTLTETGIDPPQLELEITERVVLDRTGPAKDTIERLRRLGVRFTIDDFGTGNSSLSRIGSFPVSTLKIDGSFVQVLGPDGDNDSLVTAIISMADRLGLACVAEGVETSLQSRVLLQRGCTSAQGYFFSPPLPPRDIEAMMRTVSVGSGAIAFGDSLS